ncbi:type II toxin-antitoxin system death-on-curing family toxin [Vibrio sp. B1-2]|uniref:type II toxin-antitoxin system death-on-curing family toxin n=1 Tax=Vibrio sp. B1-2 TaxID=2591465 RepID=UPI0014831F35|nr:type II toxin-antitoxin system death-on-curing family toxin [Vibrio sp. B1-2]NNN98123.1 type II toxin-antitoxin system death-on-curing family toxin [Vibrio sp. B1-2]
MSELLFLEVEDVIEIHDDILANEPGLHGTHADKVEAVIGRVKSIYSYSNDITTPFDLAAHYAVAIARGHAFNDGNKRTAFVSMVAILQVNNIPLPDDIAEKLTTNLDTWADMMVKVADGTIDAKSLSNTISIIYLVGLAGVGIAKLVSFFTK